jgi:predicted methyltransferase
LLVLSHFQVSPLLVAKQHGHASATTSADLGISPVEARLDAEGVTFREGEHVSWASLEHIQSNPGACFQMQGGAPEPIRGFSELTGRYYSLYPTESAPTLLVGGFPMHRIKGTNPHLDTLSKIKAIAPVGGEVLDTTTGLGYTAIEAARTANHVTTVELDAVAQSIARLNPWSQALFADSKITCLIGDSFDVIEGFEPGAFSCIIHDPPTLSLAGDLYSGAFYRQALRVLKSKGKMFHYVGDPESQSGRRVTRGVVRRLQEAGFSRVRPAPSAFGMVAYK